jgi:hypothetical protein
VKSTLKQASFIVALCLLARPLLAADGILIVEKTTSGTTTATNQVQIEKTRMRAESARPDGGKQIMLFDGGAQVMRMIDTDKKTYTEMTKADVDRMGAQLAGAMAQMQEQMKNMPPAARAQMEAMMKGRGMAPGATAKTEYRKAGTDKVGKWTCDKYDGYVEGQKTSEICTVDPKTLGFAVTDFQVTQQLGEFFKTLMPGGNADQMFTLGKNDPQGFSGVPIRRTYAVAGRQTTIELTDVSRQTFPDSTFAVPAGFEKKAFPAPGATPPSRRP